jgi:hypothetical protein
MARIIKPRTFGGNVTVANARQAAAAIKRKVTKGEPVHYGDAPAIVCSAQTGNGGGDSERAER